MLDGSRSWRQASLAVADGRASGPAARQGKVGDRGDGRYSWEVGGSFIYEFTAEFTAVGGECPCLFVPRGLFACATVR